MPCGREVMDLLHVATLRGALPLLGPAERRWLECRWCWTGKSDSMVFASGVDRTELRVGNLGFNPGLDPLDGWFYPPAFRWIQATT